MEYLKQYGSLSESEEDFQGYDLENGTEERFPLRQPEDPAANQKIRSSSCQIGFSDRNIDAGLSVEDRLSDDLDTDSSCSFFEERPPRRYRKKTKKERLKENSAKKRRLSHAIKLEPCGCLKKCNDKFSRDDRMQFHDAYWNLDNAGQANLIRQHAHLAPNTRRRKRKTKDLAKRLAYTCTLPSSSGDSVTVCRKFFLNTLGFGVHCGTVQAAQHGPPTDQRGQYPRSKQARDAIKEHIWSYGPNISHYRRMHAPNRLYLPSDLTETALHNDFKTKKDIDVSYSLYCKVVKECNISFVKLGHEQCEACVGAEQHQKDTAHSEAKDCTPCSDHSLHIKRATESRLAYREDAETVIPDEIVFSVDLQKVIQLPRLDGLKSIIFSQRVLVYNETFAPVGAYAKSFPVSACLWSEAISGRTANEILSCFVKVIKQYAHMKKITFWLDNCSSQNKNWNLFQHLILLINSSEIKVEQIIFKFFESGHTFMAADAFHGAVETKMRHNRVVTYDDFKSAVGSAKKKVIVHDMQVTDFFQTKFNVSQYTLNLCKPRPYVDNMRKVSFQKGRYDLGYASDINSEEFQYCNLFSKKQLNMITKNTFSTQANVLWQKSPRGIESDRKASLLAVVLPVITEEEKVFFNDLPTKQQATK